MTVCQPATMGRTGLAGQGNTARVRVTVSLSPVTDCHALGASGDAAGGRRMRAGYRGAMMGGNDVKERGISLIIAWRDPGGISRP